MGDSISYSKMRARIRYLRRERRLTQEGLAERVRISASFLGHIERGSRTPSLDTVVQIANALDTNVDHLLLGALQNVSEPDVKDLVSHVKAMLDQIQESYTNNCVPSKRRGHNE